MEILVIGGIAAGMSIASKANRESKDAKVTVIEKEHYISLGACGLPYYLGEQFDDSNEMIARTPEQMREAGINVLTRHEAISVDFDKKEVLVRNLETGEQFTQGYDRLAIATGAKAIDALKERSGLDNVFSLTRIAQADGIKERLDEAEDIVVVGGGFIGVEAAEQLAHIGKKVKLLQRSSMVMRNVFDPEICDLVGEALVETGVELLLNEALVDYVTEGNHATAVITSKGEHKADLIIEALGFRPNTAIFDDERLEKAKNGAIVTDEYGRTSIKDVYAAGDCALVNNIQTGPSYTPLATYANKMGRLIGENIVSDKPRAYIGALGSSVVRVGDYGTAVTGLTELAAKNMGLDIKSVLVTTNNHSNYWPNQEKIKIKLVYDANTRKILGGQTFGKYGAAERINATTMAVYNGNTVDELGFMDFAYSPPYASVWEALNVAGNAAK